MANMKRILFGIFAHPDDEAFGPSGTLLQEVRDGSELHLICATRGEAGNNPDHHADLGTVREQEWRASGQQLGATTMTQLHYPDGGLGNQLYLEIAGKLKTTINEVLNDQHEPVDLQFITFEPGGLTGHLDHIAISLITTFVYASLQEQTPKSVEQLGLRYFCLSDKQVPTANIDWIFQPAGLPSDMIDETRDVTDMKEQKLAVMAAHHSQRDDAAMIKARWGDALQTECFYYPDSR